MVLPNRQSPSLILPAVLLLLAGCPRDVPEEPLPGEPPLSPEVAEPSPAPEPEDLAALQRHELSVEEVHRYGEAARAVHEAVQTDPELRRLEAEIQERLGDVDTVSDAQRILQEHPQLRSAIEEAGISTENYLLTGAALFGAYNYVVMREQGVPEPFRPEYVTDAHVRFVEQNRAEVDAVVANLIAAYGDQVEP